MDFDFDKTSSVTRFGHGPGEEDITIDYIDNRRFEVRGKNISGPMIVAMDDSLEPDVPMGARLLVNEQHNTVDKKGCYVFRKSDGGEGFDIALIEPLKEGSYRYIYDKTKPQILADLSGMELVGPVWEIQVLVEIDEYETPANGSIRFDKNARKKVRLWFPIRTDYA